MQKPLLSLLAAGGVINGASSFIGNGTQSTGVELLWIANDLTLLLGLLGLLFLQQRQLTGFGKTGLLLAIAGFAFIAGPSATIVGIAAYSIGAPLIILGLLIYGADNYFSRANRRWVSVLLIATLLFNVVTGFVSQGYSTVISGLLFSAAIVLLARDSFRSANEMGMQ